MTATKLFWLGCVPVRIALAYIVYLVAYSASSVQRHRLLSLVFAIMGVGMIVTHTVGRSRGSLGQPAWWAGFRPLHAAVWLSIAACLLFSAAGRNRRSWALGATCLAIADVAIAVIARPASSSSSSSCKPCGGGR